MHDSDRPPDPGPGQQRFPIAAAAHQIGVFCRLEFGVGPILVHHQMRGTQDIQIGDHHPCPAALGPRLFCAPLSITEDFIDSFSPKMGLLPSSVIETLRARPKRSPFFSAP